MEQGSHEELLADPTGHYTTLVKLQMQVGAWGCQHAGGRGSRRVQGAWVKQEVRASARAGTMNAYNRATPRMQPQHAALPLNFLPAGGRGGGG